MITFKIEALHIAISLINIKYNISKPLLGIYLSPLGSNSLLSGFTYAYGNFSITIYNRKPGRKFIRKNVKTFFRVEVKKIIIEM